MCNRLHHAGILEYEALHQWPEQSRDLRGGGEPPRDDDLFLAPLDAFDDGVYHRLARDQLEQSAKVVPYGARDGVVENLVDHERSEETGMCTSYGHAELAQFGPQRVAHSEHAGLAGAVGRVQRRVYEAGH